MGIEQRLHERFAIENGAIKLVINDDLKCRLIDISYSGLGIQFFDRVVFKTGHTMPVRLVWENQHIDLTVPIKIQWQIADSIGVMFVDTNPEQDLIIKRIISRL